MFPTLKSIFYNHILSDSASPFIRDKTAGSKPYSVISLAAPSGDPDDLFMQRDARRIKSVADRDGVFCTEIGDGERDITVEEIDQKFKEHFESSRRERDAPVVMLMQSHGTTTDPTRRPVLDTEYYKNQPHYLRLSYSSPLVTTDSLFKRLGDAASRSVKRSATFVPITDVFALCCEVGIARRSVAHLAENSRFVALSDEILSGLYFQPMLRSMEDDKDVDMSAEGLLDRYLIKGVGMTKHAIGLEGPSYSVSSRDSGKRSGETFDQFYTYRQLAESIGYKFPLAHKEATKSSLAGLISEAELDRIIHVLENGENRFSVHWSDSGAAQAIATRLAELEEQSLARNWVRREYL